MLSVKMVKDSISEFGRRLTTMELTYPLIVHNELLTHRALGRNDSVEYEEWLEFSRNSSSNRAIPSAKLIAMTRENPYIPLEFRKSTKGMIAGEALNEELAEGARQQWLFMMEQQIEGIQILDQRYGVHKQWRNRPLGPWQYITTVVTGIDEMWEHFFSLRDHHAAQPDIAAVASLAHKLYLESEPQTLYLGEWHLPYAEEEQFKICDLDQAIRMSVARCARSSYLRQGEIISVRDDLRLADDLLSSTPPHASPSEHQARASYASVRSGNFIGFEQNRKLMGL